MSFAQYIIIALVSAAIFTTTAVAINAGTKDKPPQVLTCVILNPASPNIVEVGVGTVEPKQLICKFPR